MEPSKESKIETTHRLEREGRWEEANAFKENARQQFKGEGMSRKDAVEKSWEAMRAAFPPLPDKSLPVKEPIDDKVLPASKSTMDVNRDVLWVYDNIDRGSASQSNAPSAGAWSVLQHARKYRVWFYGTAMPCVLLKKKPTGSQPPGDEDGDTDDGIDMTELLRRLPASKQRRRKVP